MGDRSFYTGLSQHVLSFTTSQHCQQRLSAVLMGHNICVSRFRRALTVASDMLFAFC